MLSPAGGGTTERKGGAIVMTKAEGKGGGRGVTADHAGLVALPSIRQRMSDLQEVGEGWWWWGEAGVAGGDWALPQTNPGSCWRFRKNKKGKTGEEKKTVMSQDFSRQSSCLCNNDGGGGREASPSPAVALQCARPVTAAACD